MEFVLTPMTHELNSLLPLKKRNFTSLTLDVVMLSISISLWIVILCFKKEKSIIKDDESCVVILWEKIKRKNLKKVHTRTNSRTLHICCGSSVSTKLQYFAVGLWLGYKLFALKLDIDWFIRVLLSRSCGSRCWRLN